MICAYCSTMPFLALHVFQVNPYLHVTFQICVMIIRKFRELNGELGVYSQYSDMPSLVKGIVSSSFMEHFISRQTTTNQSRN